MDHVNKVPVAVLGFGDRSFPAYCGFAETVTAATDVTYDPVSEGEPTLTLYGYLDGILFKMTGAKGNVTFTLNAKAIPVM